MENLSSRLAHDEAMTLTDLQSILQRPMPDMWRENSTLEDPEAWWKHSCEQQFMSRIAGLWGLSDFVQRQGWIEHTSDWDWWIRVTYRDGREVEYDCGSYLIGMATKDEDYMSHKELSERWEFDPASSWRLEFLIADAIWYETEEDRDNLDADPKEGHVRIPIWELDSIVLGYDT